MLCRAVCMLQGAAVHRLSVRVEIPCSLARAPSVRRSAMWAAARTPARVPGFLRVVPARTRVSQPPKIPEKVEGKDQPLKTDNAVPSLQQMKKGEVRRFFRQAYTERWRLAGAVGLLLISSSVTMAVPFSVGKIIDLVANAGPNIMQTLQMVAGALVVIFIVGAAANAGRVYLFQSTSARLGGEIRNRLYSSLMLKDMTYYDNQKTGELVNRLSNDCWTVGEALTQNISDGLRSLLGSITGVAMMFYISTKLAIVGLLTVPPIAVLGVIYGRFLKTITEKILDAWAESTQVASERLGNMRTVHVFNQIPKERKLYDASVVNILNMQYKEAMAKAGFYGMAGLSGNLVVLSVLYYGGILLTRGEITVGDLSAFAMYAGYVGVSIAGLSSFYSEMMRGIGASAKVWEIMDRPARISVDDGSVPTAPLRPRFRLDDVHFNYGSRQEVPVLRGFSLDIPEGSHTAFVGASGSGKSTILSLLLRLYDPNHGKIYLDDTDIRTMSPTWLRSNFGLVPQDIYLFSGSVFENVAYGGDASTTMEEVVAACKKANAYDFIQRLPEKFDTVVGERGMLLSGGQRQRLSIARALVKNPKILLLDEATSSLDSESESQVQSALRELMKGRTVITVAHRLSTIRDADQICVLDRGRIIEKGRYAELLANPDGAFRKLIQRQMLTAT
ncbi:ATP-binding cassette sub-family B member 10, mitochondrial-like [Paramacrobiotus metropolitanus]|uniref:ATP-binding cassette sub-family B member 10, mitochondrial-like n=1 Tax=Paramacrobiotus metropolitanus TaxID=2943436 RepID=UPI002445910F|nr:ATP-binding cassette sub-family B member 10, mitochondrial-like [Paramacrobiotus metropolitanus]